MKIIVRLTSQQPQEVKFVFLIVDIFVTETDTDQSYLARTTYRLYIPYNSFNLILYASGIVQVLHQQSFLWGLKITLDRRWP